MLINTKVLFCKYLSFFNNYLYKLSNDVKTFNTNAINGLILNFSDKFSRKNRRI